MPGPHHLRRPGPTGSLRAGRFDLAHRRPSSRSAGEGRTAGTSRRRAGGGRIDDERGIILPLTALSMVALLLVATVAIDGSQAYPQRRSMQNAADAAALAGTRALDQARWFGGDWADVAATATDVAADNGAERSTCTIVDPQGVEIGPCTSQVALEAGAGVAVEAEDDRRTAFGSLVGRDEVTARAEAAATVQRFIGGTGAPFIVCGNLGLGGWDILEADGTVDEVAAAALGEIPLQAAQSNDNGSKDPDIPGCGAGAAFKGKLDQSVKSVQAPQWVDGETGNGYNEQIYVEVVSARPCTAEDFDQMDHDNTPLDCDLLVPIASEGRHNGQDVEMYVVAWAVFHVEGDGHGNPKYTGTFVSAAPYVTGGITTEASPTDASSPRVVRLIR